MNLVAVTLSLVALFPLVARTRNFNICPSRCPTNFACNFNGRCLFGTDPDYCNCCTRCYKGPGEICGGPHGVLGSCIEGYFCDQSGTKRAKTLPNPEGYCRSVTEVVFCPATACIPDECPKLTCSFGSGQPMCGCCPVCLKGLGEECGQFERCARGLYCDKSFMSPFEEMRGTCKIWSVFPLFTT